LIEITFTVRRPPLVIGVKASTPPFELFVSRRGDVMTGFDRCFRFLGAACVAAAILAVQQETARADDSATLDKLVRAYPDFLTGHENGSIIWKDGNRFAASDGKPDKSFDQKLRAASLLDQMSLAYPKARLTSPPGAQDDPGRFRNVAFFDRMYGDCSKGGVKSSLVSVPWPGGGSVLVTKVNNVADKLRAVSAELNALPANLKQYVYPSAGTFNCRVVKDTGVRSAHAWGVAIDLNTKFSDYWLWSKGAYKNRMPYEIVEIFEKHGFIWGGKWGHFDTMHFEYRPELLQ
jgi:hypothetical protein